MHQALLVLMPGAMLGAKDYESLLAAITVGGVDHAPARLCGLPPASGGCAPASICTHAHPCCLPVPATPFPGLQEQSGQQLDLWVAVPAIDWQHLMGLGFENMEKLVEYSDGLIKLAVGEAVEAGFPLQGKVEGALCCDVTALRICCAQPVRQLPASSRKKGKAAAGLAWRPPCTPAAYTPYCAGCLPNSPPLQPAWRMSLWRCTLPAVLSSRGIPCATAPGSSCWPLWQMASPTCQWMQQLPPAPCCTCWVRWTGSCACRGRPGWRRTRRSRRASLAPGEEVDGLTSCP